ncbi:hypothetical protein CDAR_118241 [Caerostris darwini]|uniref:Uncharacterized protein n=1 Tax=Caerostris darwini TaxID=1538125 RepID=A0AAV4NYC5_9ARAC|nr:hypothetical protein CDAR_118241 [Caerostris darwini]
MDEKNTNLRHLERHPQRREIGCLGDTSLCCFQPLLKQPTLPASRMDEKNTNLRHLDSHPQSPEISCLGDTSLCCFQPLLQQPSN